MKSVNNNLLERASVYWGSEVRIYLVSSVNALPCPSYCIMTDDIAILMLFVKF